MASQSQNEGQRSKERKRNRRVSQHFKLGRGQESLEFVDVDVSNDTPLFIDPGAIRLLDTELSVRCTELIQSFFAHILLCIKEGREREARDLLATLSEPNETRLGFSKGRAHGHGVGQGLAGDLFGSLSKSKAVKSGLLQDLEDAALFVDGIDRDVISDIVTNIIRGALIDFTIEMSQKYELPTKPGLAFLEWDSQKSRWRERLADLPVVDNRPLVLVPRVFVRRRRNVFSADRYYTHYVLPFLQQQYFSAGSQLSVLLADGKTLIPPYKKTVRGLHPDIKETNVNVTQADDSLLGKYIDDAAREFEVVSHEDLAGSEQVKVPNYEKLLETVLAVPVGKAHATDYHHAVEKLLSALFYPALDGAKIEQKIHEGRKRIDISYTNIARKGFFEWLHRVNKIPSSFVVVECKNYGIEIANPEFDQLTGRFSEKRGQFGILCYRGTEDRSLLVKRARDAAADGRGYVVALNDDDLRVLVKDRQVLGSDEQFRSLYDRFQEII